MGRPLRLDPEGGWHHAMNRGVDRLDLFRDDRDRQRFLQLVGEATAETGAKIGAHCLMGNHFHLLVNCPTQGLSETMQHACGRYARWFNDRHHRDGPLFRGRFTSKLVLDERYLAHLVRYIHRNPRDLGIDPRKWRWSSLAAFVGSEPSPSWLAVAELLPFVGDIDQHLSSLITDDCELQSGLGPAGVHAAWHSAETTAFLSDISAVAANVSRGLSLADRSVVALLLADSFDVPADQLAAWQQVSVDAIRMRLSRARFRVAKDPEIAEVLSRGKAVLEATSKQRRAA